MQTVKTLVAATTDKNELVKTAAHDAPARRGDPGVLPDLGLGLKDEKKEVRLAAAAAVIHLSSLTKTAPLRFHSAHIPDGVLAKYS